MFNNIKKNVVGSKWVFIVVVVVIIIEIVLFSRYIAYIETTYRNMILSILNINPQDGSSEDKKLENEFNFTKHDRELLHQLVINETDVSDILNKIDGFGKNVFAHSVSEDKLFGTIMITLDFSGSRDDTLRLLNDINDLDNVHFTESIKSSVSFTDRNIWDSTIKVTFLMLKNK